LNDVNSETLLWSGSATTSDMITLSEPFTNFHDIVFRLSQGLNITWHVVSGTNYIKTGALYTNDAGTTAIIGFLQFTEIVNNISLPIQSAMAFNISASGIDAGTAPSITGVYGVRKKQ
jgi:hypothetical protein